MCVFFVQRFSEGPNFSRVSETEPRWQIVDYFVSFWICCCFRSRQRRSSGMVFYPNMVHILPGYPKQSPEDSKVAMIALFLSLPPEVSQGTILSKDILATVITKNMSSIGKSLNGSIVSVYPMSPLPRKVPTNDLNNSEAVRMVIVGAIIGICLFVVVVVVVIAATWMVYKKSKR